MPFPVQNFSSLCKLVSNVTASSAAMLKEQFTAFFNNENISIKYCINDNCASHQINAHGNIYRALNCVKSLIYKFKDCIIGTNNTNMQSAIFDSHSIHNEGENEFNYLMFGTGILTGFALALIVYGIIKLKIHNNNYHHNLRKRPSLRNNIYTKIVKHSNTEVVENNRPINTNEDIYYETTSAINPLENTTSVEHQIIDLASSSIQNLTESIL